MSPDLRALPSVDALLRQPDVAALAGGLPREAVVELVRAEIAKARQTLLREQNGAASALNGDATGQVVAGVLQAAARFRRPSLRRVINATGVVLHTNLGRAPLSAAAVEAAREAAGGYSNLELDLETGGRGSRHTHLETLVSQVTGAEAAVAMNNNAAALMLVLAEVAKGREVIISRGQAVEIGGGFRIPDVLAQSGARLVEVGTTNRTRVADYAAAIGPETGALLHVHTSNFRVMGFTESAEVAELAALGRERGVPVIADQGSGCLLETSEFGIPPALREPTVQEYVRDGADLVCFSGDKLLGGPQAGIVAGRAALIARLKRHPLARALRLDKSTIAALAATLMYYRVGEAARAVPVWQMIGASEADLRRRAQRLATGLRRAGVAAVSAREESAIGGGSLPGVTLPTTVVALTPPGGVSVDALAARLRRAEPAVVGRIVENRLLLDPRTVLQAEERALMAVVAEVLHKAATLDT